MKNNGFFHKSPYEKKISAFYSGSIWGGGNETWLHFIIIIVNKYYDYWFENPTQFGSLEAFIHRLIFASKFDRFWFRFWCRLVAMLATERHTGYWQDAS